MQFTSSIPAGILPRGHCLLKTHQSHGSCIATTHIIGLVLYLQLVDFAIYMLPCYYHTCCRQQQHFVAQHSQSQALRLSRPWSPPWVALNKDLQDLSADGDVTLRYTLNNWSYIQILLHVRCRHTQCQTDDGHWTLAALSCT